MNLLTIKQALEAAKVLANANNCNAETLQLILQAQEGLADIQAQTKGALFEALVCCEAHLREYATGGIVLKSEAMEAADFALQQLVNTGIKTD